jgi:hypothetical protein
VGHSGRLGERQRRRLARHDAFVDGLEFGVAALPADVTGVPDLVADG